MFAPILRSSSRPLAIRSDSLTRSSPPRAPRSPSACVAATAKMGNSSMARTTRSPPTSTPRSARLRARPARPPARPHPHLPSAERSPPAPPARPSAGSRSSRPVRVGFTPRCAGHGRARDERCGNQREGCGREVAGDDERLAARRERLPPRKPHAGPPPLDLDAEPAQHALRVVARRPRLVDVVSPSANRAASRMADFTCALATGRRYSIPFRLPPRIVSGGSLPRRGPARSRPSGAAARRPVPWAGGAAVRACQHGGEGLARDEPGQQADRRAGACAPEHIPGSRQAAGPTRGRGPGSSTLPSLDLRAQRCMQRSVARHTSAGTQPSMTVSPSASCEHERAVGDGLVAGDGDGPAQRASRMDDQIGHVLRTSSVSGSAAPG
jgi:hypothetical protein